MALTEAQFNQLKQALEQKKKGGYLERVGQGIKETATNLGEDLQYQAEMASKAPTLGGKALALGRGGLRTTGAVAEAALTPLNEAPGIKQATEFIGGKLAQTTPIQKFQEWSQKHPEAAKDIENVLDITALFGTVQAGKQLAQGAQKAGQATMQSAKSGLQSGKELINKGKTALQPPLPTPKKAMGEILQGKSKDIKTGFNALKNVDTTGVKTYPELLSKVEGSIKNLATKVDDTLDDTTQLGLDKLKLSGKTKAGEAVSVDYVSRALKDLKELYTSVGDDIATKNIDDLAKQIQTTGMTRKAVNDLAKTYGQEFKEKAFSKTGDALTSVNAVKLENTREALKMIARQGPGGKVAKSFDKSMSSLYRVRDLVRKNVEAVNKLNQKIQERGLLEKFGHAVTKYGDIATGGTIRGLVGGLLPRGVGNKVMNALDLEQMLQRNLKIIEQRLKKIPSR